MRRIKLQSVKNVRDLGGIETKYGKIKAKKVVVGNETFIYPEFESIKKLAEENNIPLKELYKIGLE